MPIIQINMMQGRTKEQKQALINRVIDACVDILRVRRDQVHITLHEVPPENTTSSRE